MLEINIDHRGELYNEFPVFRLVIHGEVLIDGTYPAQELVDLAALIVTNANRITKHPGLAAKLTQAPVTAAERNADAKKRLAYARMKERPDLEAELVSRKEMPPPRNAILEAKEAMPRLRDRAIYRPKPPRPSLADRLMQFFHGWLS